MHYYALLMKFFFQQYTYIQPHHIRAKVEELFNCEDIFINAMIADLTMKPNILMQLSPGSPPPLCSRWVEMKMPIALKHSMI